MGGLQDTASLIGGPGLKIVSHQRWLLRLLNAEQALLDRIWPKELSGTLAFSIHDPLLVENARPFAIQLESGQACVVSHKDQDLIEGEAGAFSSLFSGLLSASQLAACGRIKGPRRALELLDQAIAGRDPWMVDYF